MVFFEAHILLSCSLKVGRKCDENSWLLTNCMHYDDYRTEADFLENVIRKRQSYMACLAYKANQRKRVNHQSVPIVLGTYLDYCIRGAEAVKRTRSQWGQVIIRGMSKMYFSFSTFDALSMHVRKCKGVKSVEWFFYVDNEGVALSYFNKTVQVVYKRKTVTNVDDSRLWTTLVNSASPFVNRSGSVDGSDYLDMFDIMLTYPYDMNDLKNRQFLNSGAIINKVIEHNLSRRKKKKNIGGVRLSEIFENANFFNILSKKSAYDGDDWNKNYPQNYDSTLHEGRSNKTAHYISTVTRASNEAFRNSSALVYPRDAFNYLCALNTKDLKAACEQNVLADFVMMSEESDEQIVFSYLYDVSKRGGANILLILNGFLINRRCDWTFTEFLKMKRNDFCRHVTTKYYYPYVYVFTKDSIPIKYSAEHDVYFSPAETQEYGIKFEEGSQFSTTVKCLDPHSLIKNPPAKSTVSINDIKGSVANVTSDFHKRLMCSTLGITCYIEIDDAKKKNILNSSLMATGQTPPGEYFDEVARMFGDSKPELVDTDRGKAMRSLLNMYDLRTLEYRCERYKNTTYAYIPDSKLNRQVRDYGSLILGSDMYDPPDPWNLRAWVMFGNVQGTCVEDGVVMDTKFVKMVPPVMYNACISVEFIFKTVKNSKHVRFIPVNGETSDTLIGCVVTDGEVYVKHSRHCNVLVTNIGNHYYHLVHFKPKHQYHDIGIDSVKTEKTLTVLIRGTHVGSFGVGTKIANLFGQKNDRQRPVKVLGSDARRPKSARSDRFQRRVADRARVRGTGAVHAGVARLRHRAEQGTAGSAGHSHTRHTPVHEHKDFRHKGRHPGQRERFRFAIAVFHDAGAAHGSGAERRVERHQHARI
ncbi:unnamed protein product [Macrosiphum euphorbiae]|uniref:Uncharacterized protein n=1 Tax=Macrosiphum euphorbiae TaxID=13131 RepID=A0AAV0Y267_9HEMI|nr:unnamed protein product [Macrosiphum euphorbiae]